jgi:hypothetical protein
MTFNHPTLGIISINDIPISSCVNLYLILSYAYYIQLSSLVDDSVYDALAKRLLSEYNSINHIHKYLIDEASLKAGTLYTLRREDYPQVIPNAYHLWYDASWLSRQEARYDRV